MSRHQLIAQVQAGHTTFYKQVARETLTNEQSRD